MTQALQARIDAMAYPPTHTYQLDGLKPTGPLAERVAILDAIAPGFFKGRPFETFLDVGCNKGYFTLRALQAGFTTYALDTDRQYTALCEDLHLGDSFAEDVCATTFQRYVPEPFQRFDRVFVGNVHHYLFAEARGWAWVKKLAELTRAEAQVIIEGPVNANCPDIDDDFQRNTGCDDVLLNRFTLSHFYDALDRYFSVECIHPTTSYTPGRAFFFLTRRASPLDVVIDWAQLPPSTCIWSGKTTVHRTNDGDDVLKFVREQDPASLLRSLAFACVAPYSSPVQAVIERDSVFAGWIEPYDARMGTYFQRGAVNRATPPSAVELATEAAVFRAWCRRNAELVLMGVIDEDPGLPNWIMPDDGHDWVTVDKNSIVPLRDFDVNNIARLFKTMDWSYTRDAMNVARAHLRTQLRKTVSEDAPLHVLAALFAELGAL